MLLSAQDLKAAFSIYFADISIIAIFFDDGIVHLAQNLECSNSEELRKVTSLYTKSREQAIQQGIVLGRKRYEVFRYHPPLIYGRMVANEPKDSAGIAVLRIEDSKALGGKTGYMLVTFKLPETSARIVPKLVQFGDKFLK